MGQAPQSHLICCAEEGCSVGYARSDGVAKAQSEVVDQDGAPQAVPGDKVDNDKVPRVTSPLVGAPEQLTGTGSADVSMSIKSASPEGTPRPARDSGSRKSTKESLGSGSKARDEAAGRSPSQASNEQQKRLSGESRKSSRSPHPAPKQPDAVTPSWLGCNAFRKFLGREPIRLSVANSGSQGSGATPPRRNSGGSSNAGRGSAQDLAKQRGSGMYLPTPMLLHFDVNKTIIHSDSINAKQAEDGIREAVADLFWGRMVPGGPGKEPKWQWTKSAPSSKPPVGKNFEAEASSLITYFKHCKKATKNDKDAFKRAVRTFELAGDEATKLEMETVVMIAMRKLRLPPDVLASEEKKEKLRAVGLAGDTYFIVPSLFQGVATLQKEGRKFAMLFRSFGKDHEKIMDEWNAFCELRHPLFSKLLDNVGPLDGSVPNLPDRRIHRLHTLYRDAQGPILILDTFTNGPEDQPWDDWAKGKPKPKDDTRDGRTFIKKVLNAQTVDGLEELQKWMVAHLNSQATSAIKDDWAWWQFHGERAMAGKLALLVPHLEKSRQVFFDDNIDLDDPRIVDCRDQHGVIVPSETTFKEGICVRVNPVEALLMDNYFFQKIPKM